MFKTTIPKEEDVEEVIEQEKTVPISNEFSIISDDLLSDKVSEIIDLYPQMANKPASITTILDETHLIKVPRYRVINALESLYPYHQF